MTLLTPIAMSPFCAAFTAIIALLMAARLSTAGKSHLPRHGAAEPGASVQTEKADKQDYQRDEYEPAEQFCEKFEVPQDDFLPKDKSNSCAKGTWEYERRR